MCERERAMHMCVPRILGICAICEKKALLLADYCADSSRPALKV